MSQPRFTGKNGRYTGKGDPLEYEIYGEHAPANSPFFYLPTRPELASLLRGCYYRSSVQPYTVEDFTYTETGAAGTLATDAAGLLFTNDGADNDFEQLQTLHTYTPAAGKIAVAYARLQVSDATQADTYFGFATADTSIVASEPTNSAIFKKDDGDTILNGHTNDGGVGTETSNLITNWTAATDYDLGVVIVPTSASAGTVHFCYKLASASSWSRVTKTTDFPAGAVCGTFLNQNGEAVAKTMTVSRWVFFWEN